jgi:hypothetical protein
MLSRHERFDENLEFLKQSGVPHLILWSDNAVHSFTRDPKKLEAAAERAEKHLKGLIDSVRD